MAATFPIPLTALTAGPHDFGPTVVADTDNRVTLTVDRTVTKGGVAGLNGQPPATQVSIQVGQSNDGGATWQILSAASLVGGAYTDPDSGLFTESAVWVTLYPGTGRRVKATVAVVGASVAVAGTLTTS